jgi:hypothetical protein
MLTAEQGAHYARDGFLVLPRLKTPAVYRVESGLQCTRP